MKPNYKEILDPNAPTGGELKKCEHYIAFGTQDDGFAFEGVFKKTFKKMEANDQGKMVEKQCHYFTALHDTEYFRLNKQKRAEKKQLKAGDEVGVNGIVQLNGKIAQIPSGTKIGIVRNGTKKNEKSVGTTVLIGVYAPQETQLVAGSSSSQPTAAAPVKADDNDDLAFE